MSAPRGLEALAAAIVLQVLWRWRGRFGYDLSEWAPHPRVVLPVAGDHWVGRLRWFSITTAPEAMVARDWLLERGYAVEQP